MDVDTFAFHRKYTHIKPNMQVEGSRKSCFAVSAFALVTLSFFASVTLLRLKYVSPSKLKTYFSSELGNYTYRLPKPKASYVLSPKSSTSEKRKDTSWHSNPTMDKQMRYKPKQPNIVFILADDYGYHDIGYHGSIIKTPVMDKMAAEGVTLENYYVQPICTPSRVQFLSGRYQIHTGLQHIIIEKAQPNCLPLDEVTLPQKLRDSGYVTHMVGKWHVGFYKAACLPNRRGFDSFFGMWLGGGMHYNHDSVCGQPCNCGGNGYDLHENDYIADPKRWKGKYSTTIFTDRAIDIIRNTTQEKPLFLYVAYQAVHWPMQAPKDYVGQYNHIQANNNRKTYAGMVTYMDYSVGRIVDALKKTGKWNNTVLIFSSDNGGDLQHGNNWPLRGRKNTVFEGGVRAIGFVSSPLIPPRSSARVSHDMIHITDWFPTFVQGLANGSLNGTKPLDGYNVWDTIREGKPSPRTEILHRIDPLKVADDPTLLINDSNIFTPNVNAAIHVGDWKLITHEPIQGDWARPPELTSKLTEVSANNKYQPVWLFNIKEDPLETNDLSKIHTDKVNELLRRLQYYNGTSVPVIYPPYDMNASPLKHNNFWVPWGEVDWKNFTKIS